MYYVHMYFVGVYGLDSSDKGKHGHDQVASRGPERLAQSDKLGSGELRPTPQYQPNQRTPRLPPIVLARGGGELDTPRTTTCPSSTT